MRSSALLKLICAAGMMFRSFAQLTFSPRGSFSKSMSIRGTSVPSFFFQRFPSSRGGPEPSNSTSTCKCRSTSPLFSTLIAPDAVRILRRSVLTESHVRCRFRAATLASCSRCSALFTSSPFGVRSFAHIWFRIR